MAATTDIPAPYVDSLRTRAEFQNDDLTIRELEVLKWIAEGHSTKQVAGLLGITYRTAACHRYRLMQKLGIHDSVNLVRYAIRNGIIQA